MSAASVVAGSELIKATVPGADASASTVTLSVPGVKAGDFLIAYSPGGQGTFLDQPLKADDQITQYNGNFVGQTFTLILVRFG